MHAGFAQHFTNHGTTAWALGNSVLCILKIHKKIILGVIYDLSVLALSQSWRISSSSRGRIGLFFFLKRQDCSMDGSASGCVGHGPTPWKWKGDGQLVTLEVWLAGLMSVSKNTLPVVWTLISTTDRSSCTCSLWHLGEGFELHRRKGLEVSTRCISRARSVWCHGTVLLLTPLSTDSTNFCPNQPHLEG